MIKQYEMMLNLSGNSCPFLMEKILIISLVTKILS